VLGVALLAAREYFDIAEATGYKPFRALSYIFFVLLFVTCVGLALINIDLPQQVGTARTLTTIFSACLAIFLSLPPLLLLLAALQRDPVSGTLPDAAVSFLSLPYVGFTLLLLPLLAATWNGPLFLLFLMLLVWCGDIAAYYVGRAIGKQKLAPRISPGKTWEGAVASVLGAVIVGLLLFHFINPIADALRSAHLLTPRPHSFYGSIPATQPLILAPVWFVALFAVCVNVAAQLGDLVESALKRGAGLKDSGTLLPGHGGVLDRIDALLFALPVGLIFYLAGMSRYFSYPPYTP
jgi:CDP-diglyceride synthetase